MTIRTCNGCKALNWASSNPNCTLHEEIVATKYIDGIAVSWKPVLGMCMKPKTREIFSFYLKSMSMQK